MTVRRAVKTDLDKLLLLYQHLHTDDVQAADKVLVKVWNEILEDPSLAYFVIEMDGLIVTSCNLALIPNLTRAGRPIGLIENVVTHTDYRNLGLGKKVMQSAIDYSEKMNCYKVMLLSSSGRKEAHKFYEALGFSSTEKVGYVLKFD